MDTTTSLPAINLSVSGMTCAACATRVEKALRKLPGVSRAEVNLATERASISLDRAAPAATDLTALIAAVERAGYGAEPAVLDTFDSSERFDWLLLMSVLLSIPFVAVMLMTLWQSGFGLAASNPDTHSQMNDWLPPVVQLLLAAPIQFIAGARFYSAAFKSLRAGSGNMDVLVALGTTAAFALSLLHWRQQGAHASLYFESSALVVTLVLLGRWLERRARRKTLDSLRALAALKPESATRRVIGPDGARSERVAIAQVRVDDLIEVAPGERIAVDGVIVEGHSSVDQSLLTGEPLPVDRRAGDTVATGAINRDGVLLVRTRAVGQQTLLAGVIRAVSEAQTRKAPIQSLVDRITAVFVPVVVAIAVVTFLGWGLAAHDWSAAAIHAIAVLVIACPCALGLATPTALMAGTGAAARAGILIKDVSVLEQARGVATIAFDKTGTLTMGQPQVRHFAVAPAVVAAATDSAAEIRLLRWSAAVLGGSEHPLASAVQSYATQRGAGDLSGLSATTMQAYPGRGFSARLSDDDTSPGLPTRDANATRNTNGHLIQIGNQHWFEALGIDCSALAARIDDWRRQGLTVSLLAVAGRLAAAFAFGDTVKPQANEVVAQLQRRGLQTVLISGDHQAAALALARQLNISRAFGDQLPAAKAALIAELRAALPGRKVLMVGDGINDAAALAAADIGVAMVQGDRGGVAARGGDLVMASAGITLMRGDLSLIPAALDIATATDRKIRQNLFWAFAYNVVGLPLAAFGKLDPIWAGLAMALSSISVVGNSLWLSRWRPSKRSNTDDR